MPASTPGHALDDAFLRLQSGAHAAATSPQNRRKPPTEAQARAGNYKLGLTSWADMPIRIENPTGSVREGVDERGRPWRSVMAAHYGYFAGTRGADGDGVDVFIGPMPESPIAWVLNQTKADGSFDEHKVLLGFPDQDSAVRAYTHSYTRGWDRFERELIRLTASQLRRWLHYGDKSRRLRLAMIPQERTVMDAAHSPFAVVSTPNVYWREDGMLSGGQPFAKLLYELRALDGANDLLMDPLTMAECVEGAEVLAMDALVTQVGLLKPKFEAMLRLLEAAGGEVKPVAMQISDPLKRFGGVHVVVIFEMSDGQTLSVWNHNPDSTPARLNPADLLVSWKWLMNKRDITAAVAPENGRDLNVREVARRAMRLIEANSKAFARANANRAAKMEAIQGLKDQLTTKQQRLGELNGLIAAERVAVGDRRAAREAAAAEEAARLAAEQEAAAAAAAIEPAPEGWENRANRMIVSEDPAAGGIVDFETRAGTWFVVPNDDALDFKRDGYATRADALAALAAAVAAKAAAVEPAGDSFRVGSVELVPFTARSARGARVWGVRVVENGKEFNPADGSGSWFKSDTKASMIDSLEQSYAAVMKHGDKAENENRWRENFDLPPLRAEVQPDPAPAVPDSPEVALLRDIAAGKHDAEGYRALYSRISAVVQALGETLTEQAAEAADAAIMHWADVEEATPL